MNWIAWTSDEIQGLEKAGLVLLWTEIDDNGFVTRELGFDIEGRVIHKVPFGSKRFGLFDLQVITWSNIDKIKIEPERFNEIWFKTDDKLSDDINRGSP